MCTQRSTLRILHITESPSAGVGRHVLDLAEGQLARGHHVTIIYSGARVDETFCRRSRSLVNLRTHRVDMRRPPHVSDASAVWAVRKYLRAHRPFDVAHGHSSKGGAIARLVGRARVGAVIYTPHCMYTMNRQAHPWALTLTRAVERRLARRTSAIIAVSGDEEEHIVSLGIPRHKVHCVVNGVAATSTIEREVARRRLGLDACAAVVGYLGRLSRQKNPRLLLEAFARLGGRPQLRLAIAGDGELEGAMRSAARDLAIAERVHWLGHRPAAEVLPAFDVFALPSNYEGMPYVLLEALAAGLPIVATDVGGVRLAVREGENGHVVSRPCPDEFAAAVEKLIGSPDQRAQFGALSRSMATQFTIDRMVDQTMSVYAKALSGLAVG
jgi:glycosyltransferase involved in cell wall biosynthesis